VKRYDPHSWFVLLFHSYNRNILRQLLPTMTILAVYSVGLSWFFEFFEIEISHNMAIHSILGIVLGLFLVFRTNGAYDRWWEGRKLWGGLVNTCRNFAAKIHAAIPEEKEDLKYFYQLYANFVFAMKEHLREGVKMEEMEYINDEFMKGLEASVHRPNFMIKHIFLRLNELHREGKIDGETLIVLDNQARELLDLLGGCERIKNTPIPYSYNMFLKKFIFIFITTLPIFIEDIFHWWTGAVVVLMFYIMVSTELIAEEIEDPFGEDDNDLPTDNLSHKIKANIAEILEQPAPPQP
jgi:putative membrane protein